MLLTDEAATRRVGASLAPIVRAGDVIALSGPLGVGKTSFARGLIEALGFTGEVPSPSFALVIPYAAPEVRIPVWHVDLYRIDDPRAVEELGLDDARSDNALVIEWPERFARLWPDALRLQLCDALRGERRLTADVPSAWERRWPHR